MAKRRIKQRSGARANQDAPTSLPAPSLARGSDWKPNEQSRHSAKLKKTSKRGKGGEKQRLPEGRSTLLKNSTPARRQARGASHKKGGLLGRARVVGSLARSAQENCTKNARQGKSYTKQKKQQLNRESDSRKLSPWEYGLAEKRRETLEKKKRMKIGETRKPVSATTVRNSIG